MPGGDMFSDVVMALTELKAYDSLKLLMRAKDILFGSQDPPQDELARYEAMPQFPDDDSTPDWAIQLGEVDKAYIDESQRLLDRLEGFAEERGLLDRFLTAAEPGVPPNGGGAANKANETIDSPPSVN